MARLTISIGYVGQWIVKVNVRSNKLNNVETARFDPDRLKFLIFKKLMNFLSKEIAFLPKKWLFGKK